MLVAAEGQERAAAQQLAAGFYARKARRDDARSIALAVPVVLSHHADLADGGLSNRLISIRDIPTI